MAAYIGNPSIIQSLLTNGANIEATNSVCYKTIQDLNLK